MEHTVPRSLEQLTVGRQSGTLSIQADSKTAQFVLVDGQLLSATCSEGPRLGTALCETGALTEEALAGALAIQRRMSDPSPLGVVLVGLGIVPEDAVARAAGAQIRGVLAEVSCWQEGCLFFSYAKPDQPELIRPAS